MPALRAHYSRAARVENLTSATSSSSAVHSNFTERLGSGRIKKTRQTLKPRQIQLLKEEEARRDAERLQNLTREQRREISRLQGDFEDLANTEATYEDDILHGRTAADISHAGESLATTCDEDLSDAALLAELRDGPNKLIRRYRDPRTRKDRTQRQVNAFDVQLDAMTDAYLEWSLANPGPGFASSSSTEVDSAEWEEARRVMVVDMFSASHQMLPLLRSDAYVASACVREGWMPSSPYFPSVVITLRALEVYRVTRLRCPRLGIQAFVRALCDIHGFAPRPWLGTQFSVAFDIYLAIRARVDARVQVALGRDTPNWRLKNACPACLYVLEGESPLDPPMLATMDGNNSLPRFELREREHIDEDGTTSRGALKELHDNRVAAGDYYLTREEVNRWAKDGLEDLMKDFDHGEEGLEDEDEHDNGCSERWQNMKEDVTSRAYGLYDETGFFPCLCRHSFVLIVTDMVKSGELAKYGFAVTAHLIQVLKKLGIGYDIGCKFGKMVKAHPVLGPLAAANGFRSLVGAFHGHGHNRRCALENLMTYVKGVGLEALEGCESFFSKSNALASTTRHASRFHRQQAITTYLKHTDTFETYQGLSSLLCYKYRRALEIKATYGALRVAMADLGVESRDEFEAWIAKEKAFLHTLSKEPLEETLEMEYYQKLQLLAEMEERVRAILGADMPFLPAETDAAYADAAKATRRVETQRRHAQELLQKALDAVQDLELRLGIISRWEPGQEKWEAVAVMVSRRRYQRALDQLQGLIIARMFELAKCNMAGTGYKLRKHIAKALQARSKAVKAAIDRYNSAALAMTPSMPQLEWEDVVEYAFLSDFDLLREGREDIRGEPWAQPAGRAAMDQHFKLLRADEEIVRLNVEIRRFVTYMVDEEAFLTREAAALRADGKEALAHQVDLMRMERGRFTALHMERLTKLSKEPGFTGSISPGVSVARERHVLVVRSPDSAMPAAPLMQPETPPTGPTEEEMDDDEQDDDDEDGRLADAFLNIVRISAGGSEGGD
ncbi:hypothetical protein R3P38DRAFT_2507024 [Favolaschia claudopus]|uniref:CxC1-like cysteine cluster associated with KDZ transposases domain-containing protein n=1 Tax=Favolaschia claudopus TaxID=2862362 RepID=A0AAW0D7M4_9AGAR